MYSSTHCFVIVPNSRVFSIVSVFDDSCPQRLTTNNNLVLLVLSTQLRGRPKTKCRLRKFLYCCMHICSCRKVFTKPLPSNGCLQGASLTQLFQLSSVMSWHWHIPWINPMHHWRGNCQSMLSTRQHMSHSKCDDYVHVFSTVFESNQFRTMATIACRICYHQIVFAILRTMPITIIHTMWMRQSQQVWHFTHDAAGSVYNTFCCAQSRTESAGAYFQNFFNMTYCKHPNVKTALI
jgi:hypothetical protein